MATDYVYWKAGVKEALESFSDKQHQREAWFGAGRYQSSPEEFWCGLFDDFRFLEFVDDPLVNLNTEQKRAAKEFLQRCDEYSETEILNINGFPDPASTIDDPKWDAVRHAARRFLVLIKDI